MGSEARYKRKAEKTYHKQQMVDGILTCYDASQLPDQ